MDKGVVVLRHDKGGPVAVEYEGAHGGRLLVLASSMLVVQVLIVIVGSVFLPSSYNCTFLILFLFVLVLLFFLGIQGNLKDDP